VALWLSIAAPVRAGDGDTDALVAVASALADYVDHKNDDALAKLDSALAACAGPACAPDTRAQILVAMGIVQGDGLKDKGRAIASFEQALREDPKVAPDPQFMTTELTQLFAEAQQTSKKPAAASRPRPGATRAQLQAAAAAQAQLAQKDWSSCMGTILTAMAEREFAAGELVLAQCEDAGGLMVEAMEHAKLALKYAGEEGNADVKRRAGELVTRLDADTPTITVAIPSSVDEPVLSIDGAVIPRESAAAPIPHNLGKITIEVKGTKGGTPFSFKTESACDRGERLTIPVARPGEEGVSRFQQCVRAARTPADLKRCIDEYDRGRGLTIRGGLEVLSYNDSVSVDVLSPTLFFSVEHPAAGWKVGGSYTVDVVSTASPDIVATASRRFDEVRHAGSLAGEFRLGPTRVGVDGAVSVEPDYVGRTVGATVSADLHNKQVTPTLSYHLGFDILGRAPTPFSVFSRNIFKHSIDAGVSVITSPSTLFVVGATGVVERGDTSKPYRHVPMFSADVAARISLGEPAADIDRRRLPIAPLEHLPDARERFAVLGRWAHRFESSTLRADERLYIDTWGLKASTTDAHYFVDVTKSILAGAHARFHIQGPVDFWRRAYVATPTPGGFALPTFFTGNRELGPLFEVTLGGKLRFPLNDIFAVSVQAEGIYTQFLDTIYVSNRWALFTATTLEVGIE
jgi:hypothetical protein